MRDAAKVVTLRSKSPTALAVLVVGSASIACGAAKLG